MEMISVIVLLVLVANSCGFLRGPSGFPVSKDIKEASDLTSWIKNETARDMIFHYLVLCPEQDMCLGPEFKRNFSFKTTPACTTCDCDDSCVRKATCCPSKFYRQTNTPDFIEFDESSKPKNKEFIPLSCMESLWNSEGIASGKAYWIVKTCPNSTDCLHQSMSSTNITNYTPVTSMATNETYVNFHCAFCNEEHMQNLVPWKKRKMCTLRSVLLSNDDYEKLFQYVFAVPPICNIDFYPPAPVKNLVESCVRQTYTTKCKNKEITNNRTESYLLDACQKYYLPFYTNQRIYQNVYCVLCDFPLFDINIQYEANDVFGNLDFTSFSALLNFQHVKKEPMPERRMCPEKRIFDNQMNKCRAIHCEAEYLYQDMICKPTYEMLNENNYEINLIFFPIDKASLESMEEYASDVEDAVFNVLKVYNLTDHLCRISVLIPDKSDGVFLAVVIELSLNFLHNVDLMIGHLLDIFKIQKELSLHIKALNRDVHLSLSIVGQSFHLYGDQLFEKLLRNRFYVNPMSGREMILYHSMNMLYANRLNPSAKRQHCLTNNMLSVVADWYRCPKIKIRTADAKLDVSNFSVCLTEYDVCFSSRYFKESLDKRSVELCLDKYIQAFKAINSPLVSSDGDSLEYLSLVCLSVSSLGSLATILTFFVSGSTSRLADINIIILAVLIILANTTHTVSKFFLWSETLCIGVGILVHFCWLSVVCWMSLSSFQIFQTFTSFTIVKIKVSSRVTYCLMINVMICLSLIAVNAVVSYIRTNGKNIGYSPQTCYIADSDMVLFTFVLPVGLFVCINIFMFAVTVYRISKRMNIQKSKDEKKMGAYFRLSTITGGTWILGFLDQFTGLQLFAILHALLNGGQGIFLYLAFGVSLTRKCVFCTSVMSESSKQTSEK